MSVVTLTVNGKAVAEEIENRTLLVQLLRERLRLTGTHVGCDTTQCGACIVHLDGKSVKSCTILAMQCEGADVTTIEGVADGERLNPLQDAFNRHHALQCGFCTPGMIMSCLDLLRSRPTEDEHVIREWLEGSICRCTGYQPIVDAVIDCARQMSAEPDDV